MIHKHSNLERRYNQITSLAPHSDFYWDNGSWHLGNKASSSYLDNKRLSPMERREMCIRDRDLPTLIDWMVSNKVDLCVAGEESYLVKDEGLANACARVGIPCCGPVKESAQLEASKEFAKEFLLRHHIPTGQARVAATLEEARQFIGGVYPTVLKFDGMQRRPDIGVASFV